MVVFGGALAQPFPEPPQQSEFAVRLLPASSDSSDVERMDLRSHPLFRTIDALVSKELGFDPLEFMDNTFEGTVIAAIVSGTDKSAPSSLKAFLDDRRDRVSWSETVSELSSLAYDLKDDFEGSGEPYPTDLESYLENDRYYSPSLGRGVDYRYEVLREGKGFRITTLFEANSPLIRLGEPPVFTDEQPGPSTTPTTKPVPLNLVVGAKIKEPVELAELLTRGLGDPKGGFWRTKESEGFSMVITIRGDWLVASDEMSNLGEFLKTLNGKKPGWSENPAFQKVARNLDMNAPGVVFLDTQRLLQGADFQLGSMESKLLSILGPVGYSIIPGDQAQARVEVFLGINPPQDSELASFMASSRGESASSSLSVKNIPWDVANVFAVDYGHMKALMDALVALFPEVDSEYEMGQDVFAGMLGLDAETGFNGLFEGSAIVSFERIDILLNIFDGWADVYDVNAVGGPIEEVSDAVVIEAGEDSGSEAVYESEEVVQEYQRQPKKLRIPATFAARVPVEANREALLALLQPYMGDEPVRRMDYGVEVVTGTDGLFSYAIDGDWFYLSGGRTERLMKNMLAAAHGRKETLASVDSWSRFALRSEGKLLAFGHQKVDAVYSIVKGMLLLLGSDFRPLANEIGKLRDYHSVVTVVPEGILAVGEIVRGDDR